MVLDPSNRQSLGLTATVILRRTPLSLRQLEFSLFELRKLLVEAPLSLEEVTAESQEATVSKFLLHFLVLPLVHVALLENLPF